MQFYSKAALQLIYDQVNRDNPNLPVALSPTNAALTKTPVVVSVGTYGRNTRVEFTAYPGSGLQGKITLYYDRINLSQLINFAPTIYAKASILTQKAMLATINDALGITLSDTDLASPDAAITAPNAAVQSATFSIINTSPAFTGSLVFSYQVKSSGFYPKSGPGPKNLLLGDTVMGYFGTVDPADMFSHAELIKAAFLKTYKPTTYGGTEGWYKFFYNSKVLYLPINPVGYNVEYATLYSEGLVYGTDDTGKYPMSPAVNQNRMLGRDSVSEGRFYFRVRLPSLGPDPFTNGTPGSGNYQGSEAQMFNYLVSGKWASLNNVHWNLYCLFQNSVSGNTAAAFKLATLSLGGWTNAGKGTVGGSGSSNWYWFPVLELVDTTNTLLGLDTPFGQMDMSLKTIPFNIEQSLQVSVLQPGSPKTIDFLPITFDVDQSLYVKPIIPGQPKTVDFRPIPFKTEIYTPAKIDLGKTSGELDDF